MRIRTSSFNAGILSLFIVVGLLHLDSTVFATQTDATQQWNRLAHVKTLRNRYFLMRHGESIANVEKIVSCHPEKAQKEHPLTANGQAQAEQGFREAKEKYGLNEHTIIVHSPVLRADQTAHVGEQVLGAHRLVATPALSERNLEPYHGRSPTMPDFATQRMRDLHKEIAAQDQRDPTCQIDPFTGARNVESAAHIQARMTATIAALEHQYQGEKIVLVTHGNPSELLMTGAQRLSPSLHLQMDRAIKAKVVPLELAPLVGAEEHYDRELFALTLRHVLTDPNHQPQALLRALKKHPVLDYLFVAEPWRPGIVNVEPHTERVLRMNHTYFADRPLDLMESPAFELMLALHDIGKPLRGFPLSQHQQTIQVLHDLAGEFGEKFPMTPSELVRASAMLGDDVIGSFVQSVLPNLKSADRRTLAAAADEGTLTAGAVRKYLAQATVSGNAHDWQQKGTETINAIVEDAARLQVPAKHLYAAKLRYYQCDIGGYTLGMGGYPALDFIFAVHLPFADNETITPAKAAFPMLSFNIARNRLRFCAPLEPIFQDFEQQAAVAGLL